MLQKNPVKTICIADALTLTSTCLTQNTQGNHRTEQIAPKNSQLLSRDPNRLTWRQRKSATTARNQLHNGRLRLGPARALAQRLAVCRTLYWQLEARLVIPGIQGLAGGGGVRQGRVLLCSAVYQPTT